ncbi:hypothetical protein CSV75_13955 [Sporosarcina sp. P18a]|uniref:toast rack family protein n=1 Tax=Sporosarcina sp. P18a TaxID=2048259 RepID=UPI000C169B74|nr:toast rack family protein [Sporosarcina sp. P18a]PIC79071.1 hypothetical protein CSV75_13955 [Sporosarcina sp. P18a]
MRKTLITLVGVVLLGVVSFWVYDWMKTDRVSGALSIEKDHAKSLDVAIRFGAGKLLIEGGATGWVNGDIDTSVKKWYPSVTYKNKRDVGYVEIQQKMKGFSALRKQRNDWNLQLTNEIPVNLDVEMGVSDSELRLAGIPLNHLAIDAGVGDTLINLDGEWKDDFDADINLGVGDAKIYLPKGTGVKISVSKGIGSVGTKGLLSKGKDIYVNEAYDHSDITIHLKVNVGVGSVDFLLME